MSSGDMDESALIYLALAALALFLPLLWFRITATKRRRLPPGSLGLPIIGQTFEFEKARRENRLHEWLQERARKYGPVSKMSILGSPTVFLCGQALNKFMYTADESTLSNQQPTSIRMLLGDRNILELTGQDHKRLRRAISTFLNPDALKQYIGKMDEEVRLHFKQHWLPNREIEVMPLMKTLTFNVICTLLFGIERGERRDELIHLFEQVIRGIVEIPINLPLTRFNRSLRASRRARQITMQLINEKRNVDVKHDHHPDLITCLINMRDPLLSDDEIADILTGLMIGGHDTTSTLITFLIKLLAENPEAYHLILREQEEIAREKKPEELLTWEDLNKMKYSWRAATETLRLHSPVAVNFKKVVKDIEIGGYLIPKGCQVFLAGSMTHMDESIFPDPYKFNPSRYETQQKVPPFSYVAFGGGSKMCPGNEFVRTETLTMMHYLTTRFNWKLSLKENIFYNDPMPVFEKGLPIQIEIKKRQFDAI